MLSSSRLGLFKIIINHFLFIVPQKMAIERPASCDLTKGLKRLKNDGWQTAVSYHRPQSLNLEICCSHNGKIYIGVKTCWGIFFWNFVSHLINRLSINNINGKCNQPHTNILICIQILIILIYVIYTYRSWVLFMFYLSLINLKTTKPISI